MPDHPENSVGLASHRLPECCTRWTCRGTHKADFAGILATGKHVTFSAINIGENVRITALQGAEVLLAPHQTGGCDSPDPHTMGLVNKALWENRHADPAAIEAELRGPKGRGWLMRWLPARAHDNGLFLVYSNGVGVDDGTQKCTPER